MYLFNVGQLGMKINIFFFSSFFKPFYYFCLYLFYFEFENQIKIPTNGCFQGLTYMQLVVVFMFYSHFMTSS